MSSQELQGRLAFVTGGGRGIGKAIAIELAKKGASLILNYKSDAATAEETAEELRAYGVEVSTIQGDVRKVDQIDRMVEDIKTRTEHLDILVLNAAFGTIDDVENVGRASWKATFDTNIISAWRISQGLFPLLRKVKGVVVTLSSIGSVMPFPQYVAIGVSKSATEAFTRTLATEWGRYGIRVCGVSSGPIDTRAIDWFRYPNTVRRFAIDKSVFKRMGEVDDIAPVVAFACTDAARWITGHTIIADGGISCGIDFAEFDRPDPADGDRQ